MSDEIKDAMESDADFLDFEDDYEELGNTVILQDENGNDVQFEFLDLILFENRDFVVLLPKDDEEGEVVILELENYDDENETYTSVDDERVLSAVFEIFKEKHKDEFNFI